MPERRIPRAILFDWDNTLVESWGVIHEAMNLTLAAMGHPHWTREETETRVRASLRDTFPAMFGDRWRDAERVFYNSFAAIHLQHLRALPGAGEMLAALAGKGLYLGVVSNKRGEYLRREADHLGWTGTLPRPGRRRRCRARQAGDRACETRARRPRVRCGCLAGGRRGHRPQMRNQCGLHAGADAARGARDGRVPGARAGPLFP